MFARNVFMKIAYAGLMALVSATVQAVQISDAMVMTVHVNVDSGIYFRTEEQMVDPENCGSTSWYRIKSSSSFGREAYAMLLAASLSKAPVTFYFSGCDNGYPKVTYLNVSP